MRSASSRFMTKARVVVPLAAVAVALAGCGASAPSAAPPSGATPAATGTSPAAAPSTSTGVPTVSSAPTTSSANAGATCTTDDGSSIITPGVLAPSTKKAAWGKPLTLSQTYGGTASVTPSLPVAKKASSSDLLGPPAGQQYLLVKVTITYKSGYSVVVGSTDFTLRDTSNNVCSSDSFSSAVPSQQQFDIANLDSSSRTYTGTLVFDVPIGQDYSKYTLLYLDDMSSSAQAQIAWTN
ncbi:DUF4352 domain-containing protein [Rudaeicoccus suwonensis]|uniref:Uncharacterized protein DUF4352 n=1 Tax=Rudaeicoccus suwonensis TaxID=657409 RepID=A0A561ECE6_9MICO|nr:DUF4352 domain-containing protein [Rudaeicoccus suwonensis]TWE13280.1 uncharacterized protein DUF4352 [Rudaeicoccus suwonensis]